MRLWKLAIIILITSTVARAKPQVVVRGHAAFSEFKINRIKQTIGVSGRLIDDQQMPIPHELVVFDAPINRRLKTDSQGRFAIKIPDKKLSVELISVEYGGNSHMAGCALRRRVETRPPQEELTLRLPASSLVTEKLAIRAELKDQRGKPIPKAPLHLQIDGRSLSRCSTRASGQCVWQLSQLSRGLHEFRVTRDYSSGDQLERFQTILVQQPMQAEMALREVYEQQAPELRVSVTLKGPRPATAVVGVRVGEHTVATTPLSAEGAVVRIPWSRLKAGPNRISAFIRADTPGWLRYEVPVEMYDRPAQWVSAVWPKWALGLSVLVCLTVVSNRMWSRTNTVSAQVEQARPPPPETEQILHRGRHTGPPVLRILDAITNAPLFATVTPLDGPQFEQLDLSANNWSPNDLETDPLGHLALRHTCHGALVKSDGFFPALVIIPPQCAQLIIRLWSPRATVENRFVECLAAAGLPPLHFGRETAREAGILLIKRGASASDVQWIVERVDTLCFGRHNPTLASVNDITQRVIALREQMGLS